MALPMNQFALLLLSFHPDYPVILSKNNNL